MEQNPIGLDGMEFIEYVGPKADFFQKLFAQLGMVEVARHKTKKITLYRQNDVNFLLNQEPTGFAVQFAKDHGPSICSTGFRVKDAKVAFETAVEKGAKPFTDEAQKAYPWPAIYGIGDSLVYFIDRYQESGNMYDDSFEYIVDDVNPKGNGFQFVDHMTNNVPKGELDKWATFYEDIFNFREIRFFDIKGSATGLLSKAMRSPCGKITIPINEPTDDKSQIQEYIEEYKGSGIQHVALATNDICDSVSKTRSEDVQFCLLYTSPSPRDRQKSRMPSSA